MKKIICLILALCCAFSIVSCSDSSGGENDQAFFDAVASSNSTQIKTLTYYTEEGIGTLNGAFETTITDDGFVFEYSYTRIATLEDAENEDVIIEGNRATVAGKVYYENGKYSTDRVTWFSEAPAVMGNQIKLNISKDALGDYEINDAKTKLTATLTSEEAEALLGLVIEASSDIEVTISTNGTYLTGVSVSYTRGTANVIINTSYS